MQILEETPVSPVTLSLLIFLALPVSRSAASPPPEDPLAPYRDPAAAILGEALLSPEPYATLEELCDRFGNRLSGSETLENAIEWAKGEMEAQGLENVHLEEVTVPHWVRGEERAWITTATTRHELSILGLGMSVGTPVEGIEAEVVVVSSFDELHELGEEAVRGRIVLYDVPFTSYGKTVRYRVQGASKAAALGAVAALVRSVGPISYDTPHTGTMHYDEDLPRIPAAAVTIENATLMHRLQDRGERVVCHLEMGAQLLPDAVSHNLVAEWRGREKPEEIVVLAGHLDSWDVGQGAQDDGVGSIIAWQAVRTLQRAGLRPRRTLRIVLFTNEENGLAGGKQYSEDHRPELARHVALIESDSGNGLADGFRIDLRESPSADPEANLEEERTRAIALLERFTPLFEPLKSTRLVLSHSGADVSPMVQEGAVGLGLDHDTSHYFDIHHTQADTFDKVDENDLRTNVASMALMAYLLAEMPERLRE